MSDQPPAYRGLYPPDNSIVLSKAEGAVLPASDRCAECLHRQARYPVLELCAACRPKAVTSSALDVCPSCARPWPALRDSELCYGCFLRAPRASAITLSSLASTIEDFIERNSRFFRRYSRSTHKATQNTPAARQSVEGAGVELSPPSPSALAASTAPPATGTAVSPFDPSTQPSLQATLYSLSQAAAASANLAGLPNPPVDLGVTLHNLASAAQAASSLLSARAPPPAQNTAISAPVAAASGDTVHTTSEAEASNSGCATDRRYPSRSKKPSRRR